MTIGIPIDFLQSVVKLAEGMPSGSEASLKVRTGYKKYIRDDKTIIARIYREEDSDTVLIDFGEES